MESSVASISSMKIIYNYVKALLQASNLFLDYLSWNGKMFNSFFFCHKTHVPNFYSGRCHVRQRRSDTQSSAQWPVGVVLLGQKKDYIFLKKSNTLVDIYSKKAFSVHWLPVCQEWHLGIINHLWCLAFRNTCLSLNYLYI